VLGIVQNETEAEDITQDVFIKVFENISSFKGDSKFSTWLYRIALNTAISDLRKQKKHVKSVEPELLPTEIQDIQYSNEKEERLQQLYKAINHLTEIERAIVMLYLEDKSYEEMEDILGINQNNLRVKMNRIKEKLRKLTKSVEHGVR
jgi:RNA polymerase sigma-70 factor (ECF subfamily)